MANRILYTASTYSHIANFHIPYIRTFTERGYEVDIACGGNPQALPYVSRVIHLPLEKSMFSLSNFSAVKILRKELHTNEYELISCHTALASFFTRMAVLSMSHKPPVACTAHGYLFDDKTPSLKKALLVGAEKLTAPVTTLLMTMNAWDNAFARAHHLGKKIVSIPGMGVDFSAMKLPQPEECMEFRRGLGFTEQDFLLVYAAEFSKRKNHEVLLRAVAELPEKVKLLLPGDGVLRTDCMELAKSLGIEQRVVFPGQVHNMPLWYGVANGAVSSSRSEGLPFNIMEAMGAGLPVVASAVKGHTDLIEPGKTGLLFPADDPDACRAQLQLLLEDQDLCHRLGDNGRDSMKAYDLSCVMPQVMKQYNSILQE